MSFAEAVRTCFGKYADFSGRASRPEYWWFAVFTVLVYLVCLILMEATAGLFFDWLSMIAILALALPGIAATVRRLHDIGRTGWWYLLVFVPFGALVIFVFTLLRSESRPNHYGAVP